MPALRSSAPLGTAEGPPGPPSDEELIVEIELAPGAVSLRPALIDNTAAFTGAAQAGAAPPDTGLGSVLRRHRLIEARPTHGDTQVRQDEQRTAAIRAAAAIGAASPEQAAARERLPSKASFITLRFPPGTDVAKVTEELRQLPEVDKAVWRPRAAPPMAVGVTLPADPLIGTGPIVVDPATQLETQWYLHRTRVLPAWRYSRGANVVIADIDWGYRTSHQEFSGAIERTYNAVSGRSDVTQRGAARRMAQRCSPSQVPAPMGPGWPAMRRNPRFGPSRPTARPRRRFFEEPWAEAIDFVSRTDASGRRKVIILEVQTSPAFGNYEQIPSVHRAIRAAIADNCVVCVAAGNGNRPADRNDRNEPFDPTGSILVGATAFHETQNKRASFSNYGSRVVVSAPGDPRTILPAGRRATRPIATRSAAPPARRRRSPAWSR